MNKPIDLSKVSSVYNGRANSCCCGCSGTHTYTKVHQEWASKDRGYKVQDEEVNDREVKRIIGVMNRRIEEVQELSPTCLVLPFSPKREYIAYLEQK